MYEHLTAELGLYPVKDWCGKDAYGICIQLYENKEPFARLTVSFGEFIGLKNTAYIDVNNFPDALKYIEEQGIGVNTGFTKQSGFCEYPAILFNEEWLKNLDPKTYKKYADKYDELMLSDEEPEI